MVALIINMISKIESWAKESEEKRLFKIIKGMDERGYPRHKICEYLCKVANRYLAERGYDKNGNVMIRERGYVNKNGCV